MIDPRIRPARLFVPFARADLDRSIPARFADQVARHGARPAIWTPRGALSYAEVDGASSQNAIAQLRAGSNSSGRLVRDPTMWPPPELNW